MIYSAHAVGSAALATERVERRLAAILAADVVGYSRLMGADEEGTHERLKTFLRQLVEPKIKEHRARIVKNTGDGILAEFPSVVDAVRCAAEIQPAMIERNADIPHDKRISFRIGINLGDVIVEPGDIFGDGINIAARLEALAEPGGICISGVVHNQVRDKLPYLFEDIGAQSLKNIDRPVHVYRIRIASSRLSAECRGFYAVLSLFPDCELLHTSFSIPAVFYGVWTDEPSIWETSTGDRSRSFAVDHHFTGE